MAEFAIFIYAFTAIFIVQAISRNQREQRPVSQMMTMVGWGLFSLSSTLAVLLGALALALALGANIPLPGAPLP